MQRAAFIAETVAMLKERYRASPEELLDALSGDVSIPANIFAASLTPWEAACTYLSAHRGFALKDIARALGRSPSSVSNALRNAKKKGEELPTPKPGFVVATAYFRDTDFPPLQVVAYALHTDYGLDAKQIAQIIGREQSNVRNALTSAQEELP